MEFLRNWKQSKDQKEGDEKQDESKPENTKGGWMNDKEKGKIIKESWVRGME